MFGGAAKKPSFFQVLNAIEKAKDDDNIEGIFYNAAPVGIGKAKLAELQKAMLSFKESGKFIYSFINELIGTAPRPFYVCEEPGAEEFFSGRHVGNFLKDAGIRSRHTHCEALAELSWKLPPAARREYTKNVRSARAAAPRSFP